MSHGESSEFDAIVSNPDTAEHARHVEMASKATVADALAEMIEDYDRFRSSRDFVVERCQEIVSSPDQFPNVKAAATMFLKMIESGELK